MGCGSSSAVKTSKKSDSSPQKNGSPNTFRGDRLSIVDARHRRDQESRERRRRLSQLQTSQVDKARSSVSSSRGNVSDDQSNHENSLSNKHTIHVLKTPVHENGISDTNSHHATLNSCSIKVSQASDSESDVELNYIAKSTDNRKKKISDIDEGVVDSSSQGSDTRQYNMQSPKNNSQLPNSIVFTESINPRKSTDSLDIKNNAYNFVDNIMSNALMQMQHEKTNSQTSSTSQLHTTCDDDTKKDIGHQETPINDQAKDFVNHILHSAVLQIKKDKINNK